MPDDQAVDLAEQLLDRASMSEKSSAYPKVGDTLIFMDDGVVVETGPPREVLASPAHEGPRRSCPK